MRGEFPWRMANALAIVAAEVMLYTEGIQVLAYVATAVYGAPALTFWHAFLAGLGVEMVTLPGRRMWIARTVGLARGR